MGGAADTHGSPCDPPPLLPASLSDCTATGSVWDATSNTCGCFVSADPGLFPAIVPDDRWAGGEVKGPWQCPGLADTPATHAPRAGVFGKTPCATLSLHPPPPTLPSPDLYVPGTPLAVKFMVADAGGVAVAAGLKVCLRLRHLYYSDLNVYLRKGGTSVTLWGTSSGDDDGPGSVLDGGYYWCAPAGWPRRLAPGRAVFVWQPQQRGDSPALAPRCPQPAAPSEPCPPLPNPRPLQLHRRRSGTLPHRGAGLCALRGECDRRQQRLGPAGARNPACPAPPPKRGICSCQSLSQRSLRS
jgi:hypothetical protein